MQNIQDKYRQSIEISQKVSISTHQKVYNIIDQQFKYGKLGLNQLYYQKNNQLVLKYIVPSQKTYSISKFNHNRQLNQKGIKQFKHLYSNQDFQVKKKKRRLASIDNQYLGYYNLNNWISNQDLLCQKSTSAQDKSSCLIYQILYMQWQKAIQIVNSMQKTAEIVSLQYILLGFKNIYNLLQQDKILNDYFMGRTKYQINIKQKSSDSVSIGTNYNFVNILQYQSRNKFNQIKSITRKAQIVKINLEYLVRFTGNFRPQISNDYIKFAFKILGNQYDQQQQNIKQDKDYLKLLLKYDLKLTDRLNYALKLLNDKKKKRLCLALQQKLCQFPSLDNIIYYIQNINKNKQKKIEEICKLYLDQYGDLQTIAYLSYQFNFLKPYLKQFKQALQLSYQQRQLQRLQNYRQNYQKNNIKQDNYKKFFQNNGCFFDYINTSQQKVLDWKNNKNNQIMCQTCYKVIQKAQNLLICGKCKHGGHVNHILKWFKQHQNCPHIGCPCFCN